jgi:hypothetical protein
MIQIYNEITINFYKARYPPSALPRMEECTYFWGVNTSWGINTAESKRPLNQEDNQAP